MFRSADSIAPERRCDVLIAGAGPAGAIAARELALSNLSVVVADALSGAPARLGEVLPGAAIRFLKRVGLHSTVSADLPRESSPIARYETVGGALLAWGHPEWTSTEALEDPYGMGLRLDRVRFDTSLRHAARVAGAHHVPSNVVRLARRKRGWDVFLQNGESFLARWVVDATGRRSRLAQLIGKERQQGAPLIALYTSGYPESSGSLNRTVISACPNGWLYSGRLANGKWVIGYHTTPKEGAALRSHAWRWDRLMSEHPGLTRLLGKIALDLSVTTRDARGGWLEDPQSEGWIACGDAALAFDPIAGQGLFNALYTGMTAAEVVRAWFNGVDDGSRYRAELKEIGVTYAARRRALYRQEKRWSDASFWRMHQA